MHLETSAGQQGRPVSAMCLALRAALVGLADNLASALVSRGSPFTNVFNMAMATAADL